jgi:tight adherence protein B
MGRTLRTSEDGWLRRRLALVGAAVAAVCLGVAAPSAAETPDTGSIDHIRDTGSTVQVLYSLPGLPPDAKPDLSSLKVSMSGRPQEAQAEIASQSADVVRRTAVLAIDVSDSMAAGDKFTKAKAAADAFLRTAPPDVYVGLVTFAGTVKEVQEPTLDRAKLVEEINGLSLSFGTRLFDGVRTAVAATGNDGARSVLVLSDGKDRSGEKIDPTLKAIRAAKVGPAQVKVDVVALDQDANQVMALRQLAEAGGGEVLPADAEALGRVFRSEANTLAQQLLITFTPPAGLRGTEGTLAIAVDAAGTTYADSAFITLVGGSRAVAAAGPLRAVTPGLDVPGTVMLVGLLTAATAVAFLVVSAASGVMAPQPDRIQRNIDAYTRRGARRFAVPNPHHQQSVTQHAVGAAAKVLESNKGMETAVGQRLAAAGMQLKPEEWLLIHAGILFGAGLLGLLLSGGGPLLMLTGLVIGGVGPLMFLGLKRTRRVKAFDAQLADTLQLMAGSLSAGLSLAQSTDTVVREGSNPVAAEFRRALVEVRLGVEIEHALDGVADRMGSKDFGWVVMAIRIQREVGGNLAELLNKVADTIREREYLERQVRTLSAEGRLSVWVLGALPPGFLLYLMIANPAYLHPLVSTTIGVTMLCIGAVLLVTGILWMRRLVRVDI